MQKINRYLIAFLVWTVIALCNPVIWLTWVL